MSLEARNVRTQGVVTGVSSVYLKCEEAQIHDVI
jgi:hypothetical protein